MRTLVSGNPYPVSYRGQVVRLAQIITDIQTHYFGSEETDYDGHHYRPWLIMEEPIHRYRSLQVDSGSLKLQNVTGELETLLAAENWEGAKVRILDYFTALPGGVTDCCELLRGVLTEMNADQHEASWQIVPEWDPGTIEGPPRSFGRNCSWRYKSPECGSTSSETTCDKTWAACAVRVATPRFNGFLQISTSLEQLYPPSSSVNQPMPGSIRVRGSRGTT
jgi:phage-related protein